MTKDNDASLFLSEEQIENIRTNPDHPKRKITAPASKEPVDEGEVGDA